MNVKYIVISTFVFIISQVLIWYQLNSQLVWKWAEGYKSMLWMSLLGIPISLLMWLCTKWGYIGFGSLWAVRFVGFATSMLIFPIMTYWYLGEPMTLKVIITMLLAIIILILHLL